MALSHLPTIDNKSQRPASVSPPVRTDPEVFKSLLEETLRREAEGVTADTPPVSKARLMDMVNHVRRQMDARLMQALASGAPIYGEAGYPGLADRLTIPPVDSSNKHPAGQNIDGSKPRAQTHGVDPALVRSVIKAESNLNPNSTSPRGQIESAIRAAARTHGVDPALVRSVIKAESDFNPNSTSPKGAMGLMQLMPQTARELGVQNGYDPVENVQGGTRYLKMLLNRYDGDLPLALAAYNWGMGNLENRPERMPAETRRYVEQVTRHYAALKS